MGLCGNIGLWNPLPCAPTGIKMYVGEKALGHVRSVMLIYLRYCFRCSNLDYTIWLLKYDGRRWIISYLYCSGAQVRVYSGLSRTCYDWKVDSNLY